MRKSAFKITVLVAATSSLFCMGLTTGVVIVAYAMSKAVEVETETFQLIAEDDENEEK